MFKRFFGIDPLSKVLKEYKTIKALEVKVVALKEKVDLENEAHSEIINSQIEMLQSNFRDLAHVFSIENVNKKFDVSKPSTLLNFKTAPVLVHRVPFKGYTHFDGVAISNSEIISNKKFEILKDLYLDILQFELNFKRIDGSRLKKIARDKLESKINTKVTSKINRYCDNLGENSEAAREYIFANSKNLDDIISKLNNVINLEEQTAECKNYIGFKDLLTIYSLDGVNNTTQELEKFLLNFKNNKYDFILLTGHIL